MSPRSCQAVLALTAALLAGTGQIYGQRLDARPPTWAAAPESPHAPSPTATAPPTAGGDADRTIIATTHGPTPPRQPSATPAALPDDGLEPPPPIPVVAPVVQAKAVGNTAAGQGIEPALFHPDSDAAAMRLEPAVVGLVPGAGPADAGQRAARLDVEVAGPATIAPGEPLHYEIIVRNVGAAPVALVHVEDPLPPGARVLLAEPPGAAQADLLSWDLGNVEPGGERRLKVTLQHSGKDDLLCTPRVAYTAAVGLRTRLVRPSFALALYGPETTERGATVSFRIELANNGPAPLRHVVLRDKLPAGLQHPQGEVVLAEVGDLAPGQSRILQLDATAVQGGNCINEVTATADGGVEATSRFGVQVRDVGLALRLDAPRQATTGQEFDCRLEAANPARSAAKDMRLTLTLPDGLELRSAGPGGDYDLATRRVVWAPVALEGGQTHAVTVRLRGRSAGEWSCQATAEAEHLGAARTTQAVRVDSGPALHVEMLAQEDPLPVSCETVYLIHVLNQGEGPATNVRLAVVLPDGLTPLQADGPTACHIGPQQVVADPLPAAAPRQTVEYRVRVRGRGTGTWRLEADVTADQAPQPVREQVAVHVTDGRRAEGAPFAAGR